MQEKLKYYAELADEFLNSDLSLTKIAEREHTTRQTLAKYFKLLGVEIVNKQNRLKFDNTIFDSIDSEEKAYWLGFIFADGYITSSPLDPNKKAKYTLEVSLEASDSKHLDKLNKFMKCEKAKVTISDAKCGNVTAKRCRWTITDKHLWEILNSYGCTPRKSLTLEFPNESIFKDKSLIRHFIRGYFDGDGCFTRQINIHVVTPIIKLIGTKSFLEKIIEYSGIYSKFTHDKRHTDLTWSLEYHKDEGVKLINYLYKDSIIYLDRKYKLYNFFKEGSRSVEEFTELLSSNIGETPEMDNTEITTEIKESVVSYSVEGEPNKSLV